MMEPNNKTTKNLILSGGFGWRLVGGGVEDARGMGRVPQHFSLILQLAQLLTSLLFKHHINRSGSGVKCIYLR